MIARVPGALADRASAWAPSARASSSPRALLHGKRLSQQVRRAPGAPPQVETGLVCVFPRSPRRMRPAAIARMVGQYLPIVPFAESTASRLTQRCDALIALKPLASGEPCATLGTSGWCSKSSAHPSRRSTMMRPCRLQETTQSLRSSTKSRTLRSIRRLGRYLVCSPAPPEDSWSRQSLLAS